MGNNTAKPRGFSSPNNRPMRPNTPSSSNKNIDDQTNNNKQSKASAKNAQNMTTNDFLDDMIDDINDDENKINDTNITHNGEYILKKKICAYNTNEFDDLFDEFADCRL
eukprot:792496_1